LLKISNHLRLIHFGYLALAVTPLQSICEQLLYEKAKNRRQLRRLKFVWIERDPVLMREAEFVRRTSSVGSVGSLELDDCLSSHGSMPLDAWNDLDDSNAHLEQHDGPIDFDAAFDRAMYLNQRETLNHQLARLLEEEHSIDIASQLFSVLPPGKTTDKELDELYASGDLYVETEGHTNTKSHGTNTKSHGNATTNLPSIEPNVMKKRRPSFVVDDETSFAENDQSWLMEPAPVVKSLAQVLDMNIYLTGDAPAMGSVPYARYGRPDIKGIFLEMKQEALDAGESRVAVCVSAPSKLAEMCRNACLNYSDEKIRFDFHSEVIAM
jgi:hypothetical protein